MAPVLMRRGMEPQPDPLPISENIPVLSRHIRNHSLTLNDTKLLSGSFVSSNAPLFQLHVFIFVNIFSFSGVFFNLSC